MREMVISDTKLYRVGLNAQLLSGEQGYRSAGIHGYINGLLSALPQASDRFAYTVFLNQAAKSPMNGSAQVVTTGASTRQPLGRILWEQMAQPFEVGRQKLDLLHSLAFVSPVMGNVPTVVTVYDLSFIKRPYRLSAGRRAYLSLFTRLSCQRGARVLAISEATKRDVIEAYGLPADRVDVAYPGLTPGFGRASDEEIAAFRQRRGLPERYILYVGTIEPRKNLSSLIRAFGKARPDGVKLICVGGRGWFYEDVFQTVEELHLTRDVIFPGFVPAEELHLWYSAACLFAYPSSYEGFGIPVIEALACGVPTITTNSSSLPEAAGDAGYLVPPNDDDALAEALAKMLDRGNPLAAELATRGPLHAARFTWAAAAHTTTRSYARALGLSLPD